MDMNKRDYFQKQRRFFHTIHGNVLFKGLLLRFYDGKIMDAEVAPKGAKAALKITEAAIDYSPKLAWAMNKALVQEFVERTEQQLEHIEVL